MFGLIGTIYWHTTTPRVDTLSYRPVPRIGIVQEYFLKIATRRQGIYHYKFVYTYGNTDIPHRPDDCRLRGGVPYF